MKHIKDDFAEHGGAPEAIVDVICDMSPAFIKGIEENLPNAQITFDKFHIIKTLNTAVDEVLHLNPIENVNWLSVLNQHSGDGALFLLGNLVEIRV
jgi:hypothetical protein